MRVAARGSLRGDPSPNPPNPPPSVRPAPTPPFATRTAPPAHPPSPCPDSVRRTACIFLCSASASLRPSGVVSFLDAGSRGRRVQARHCRTEQSRFCRTRSHPVTPSPLGTLVPLLRGGLVPALEHQVQSSGFCRLTGWGESSDGAHSLGSWCLESRHDPASQPAHRSFPGQRQTPDHPPSSSTDEQCLAVLDDGR